MNHVVSVVPPSHALRLRLLGPLELSRSDGTSVASILTQPKRLALLAFLALGSGGRFQRRDVLLNIFWPEFDQERARAALRKALYFLRQSLGEDVVIARGDEELGLNADRIGCDALAFQMANTDQPEQALDLYRGDLLPGFFISGEGEFEAWLEGERVRLRLLAARVATVLSERAEAVGDLETAVRSAQAALKFDASSDVAFRRLAVLLHGAGDRAALAQTYDDWRRRLQDEYGVEPSPETQELVSTLLVTNGQPACRTTLGSAESVPVLTAQIPDRIGSRKRLAWAAGVILLAGGVAGAILIPARAVKPDRVLVTVFENQTGDAALDPVGRMAADWIARGLMQTGNVEVVSEASAQFVVNEDEDSRARTLAERTGAGTVVSGTYYLEAGVLRMLAQVTDVPHGKLLNKFDPINVSVDSAIAGAELLRQRVSSALAARFDWPSEWTELTHRSQPPTYAAYREYVQGWDLFAGSLFMREQAAQAVTHFERAWALDSTFYLAPLYASLMYSNLGDRARSDSILQSVAQHRDQLAPVERVLLEHFQANRAADHEAALRTAREMNRRAPNSMLAGYASLAVATNRPREAVEVHNRLNFDRDVIKAPEIYTRWLTVALHMLGQYRRELKEARMARVREPKLMGPLFVEARALAGLGRTKEVESLMEETLSMPAQSFTPAAVMFHTAVELRAHGHSETAARLLTRALAWYDTLSPQARRPQRETLARTLYEADRLPQARALFEQLAVEQPTSVTVLGSLGTIAARQGNRSEAQRILTQLASLPDSLVHGGQTFWRAKIMALLGDSQQALTLLRQAFTEGLRHDLWQHHDRDLDSLRDKAAFREMIRLKD